MKKNGLTSRVLKTIGIFSGAEAFGIVCSVVKMKIVSLWLGATGVGLFGIFNNSVETISILTGLGLRQSGVRAVSKHHGDAAGLHRIVNSLRGWSLLAGALGALVVSVIAPWLSLFFFDDYSYWWQFMILGATLLFNGIAGGEQAIFQGTQHLQRLAKASVCGAALGLGVSIPMFRYMGDRSVVFSILAYSLSVLLFLFIFRNRELPYRKPRLSELKGGKTFAKLGGYMAAAAFTTNLAQMLFLSWLNRDASTAEVGYFQAGNALVFRYTSLIFGAVGLEFYPRMAANSESAHRMSLFVSHEIGLLLKIFTPLLILFILCRRWIVELLYTSEFEVVMPFITIGIFTVILRSVSNCMAFSIIAKGEGKTFLITEGADAAVGLVLNILLYKTSGLLGLGIAQVGWYFIYTLIAGGVYFWRYHLSLTRSVKWAIAGYSALCGAVCLIAAFM